MQAWQRTAAVAGGVVLLAAGLTPLGLHLRDRRLGRKLVAEVTRLAAEHPRPTHRPASGTGTFEACLARVLDEAPIFSAFPPGREGLEREAEAVVRGTVDPGAISPELAAALAEEEPFVEPMLACTLAPAVGAVPGLGPGTAESPRSWTLDRFAPGRLAMIQVRRDLAGRAIDPALQRCADTLALARDLARFGWHGAELAVRAVEATLRPCAAALRKADPASRQRFLEEAERVEAAMPRASEVLAAECVNLQLREYGRSLEIPEVQALPPSARALAHPPPSPPRGGDGLAVSDVDQVPGLLRSEALGQAVRYLAWGAVAADLERLVASSDGPDGRRGLARADDELAVRLLGPDGPAPPYDLVPRGIALLEQVARLEPGEAPNPDGGALTIEWTQGTLTVLPAPPHP